jgi:hypothetical protein
MNSQFNTDAHIDQVLDALRTTEPPTGLEQRIAARLAQAAEARTQTEAASSYFAVILKAVKDPCISLAPAKSYSAAALTVVIALTTLTILHRHSSTTTQSQFIPFRAAAPEQTLAANTRTPRISTPAATSTPTITQVPQTFALGSHTPLQQAGFPPPPSAQDPEAIALAETLAPSRPAPPMPLTAQEKLIQTATRPGQPIQLAELDLARAPILRAAAEARETASIESYVKTLLAPFAVADALQPTTSSQPQEAPTSAPAEPTSNPSN